MLLCSVVTVIETGTETAVFFAKPNRTETAVFSSKPNRNRPTLASMKL